MDIVEPLSMLACLHSPYLQSSVYGANYPALISLSDGLVSIMPDTGAMHGILLQHLMHSQWAKIDEFEGEMYKVSSIVVTIKSSDEEVDADVYMWGGDGVIMGKPWDFNVFI
jgi:Gamma-glutamyl cyclotransferase, AIG2-like